MIRFSVVCAIVVVMHPGRAYAQSDPDPVPLKSANGHIGDSLPLFNSVRELSDGHVLIPSDHGGVWVADFTKQNVTLVPHLNNGLHTGTLLRLAVDTTAVTASSGWLVMRGADLVGQIPASDRLFSAAGSLLGVDTLGYALKLVAGTGIDSSELFRINRASGSVESIAKLWRGPVGYLTNSAERASISPDGWIAVLRAQPWRVDWREPNGKWIRGALLPVSATVMDERQRSFLAKLELPFHSPGYERPASDYPARREPFDANSTPLPTSDGRVLILRTPTADDQGNTYIVVTRDGSVSGAVEINPADRVVGFGSGSVFVRQSRGDGFPKYLERHPWP